MSVRTHNTARTGLIVIVTLLVAATALLGARTASASTSSSTVTVCKGWWIFRSCFTYEPLPSDKHTMCHMEENDPGLVCLPGLLVGPPRVKLGKGTYSAATIATFVATDTTGCLGQGGSVVLVQAGLGCWKSSSVNLKANPNLPTKGQVRLSVARTIWSCLTAGNSVAGTPGKPRCIETPTSLVEQLGEPRYVPGATAATAVAIKENGITNPPKSGKATTDGATAAPSTAGSAAATGSVTAAAGAGTSSSSSSAVAPATAGSDAIEATSAASATTAVANTTGGAGSAAATGSAGSAGAGSAAATGSAGSGAGSAANVPVTQPGTQAGVNTTRSNVSASNNAGK